MKSVNVWWLAKVVIGVVWFGSGVELQAQRLTWLGTLPGYDNSGASGVSADGSVVVGGAASDRGDQHAFRWTALGGMEDLGTFGGYWSGASGVSADGSVVVGWIRDASGYRAFRWTASGGMQDLGTLGGVESEARGVSADGSVVVGWAGNASGFYRAFRWTASGGMQDLGTLPGGYASGAFGVSADGSVVVGRAENANGDWRAFRWTALIGMEDLGTLPGGYASEAFGVSANGSVVVGWARNASYEFRAFRWTALGGMEDLGTLPGGYASEAFGVSADGSVVVGRANNANGDWRAFRWTASGGMEDLNITYADLLTNGSVLREANAISPDGRYIVGGGMNEATGSMEAFLLDTRRETTEPRHLSWLGTLGGGQSEASGISANGSVVVGQSDIGIGGSITHAFRWTQAGGMEDLGTLGGAWSAAYGVSVDGSVVVGWAQNASGDWRAFRWTASGGMQDLGTLGGDESEARGVSADGSVVVGKAQNASGAWRAFRWTASGGMQDLGTLPGSYASEARGVSADGSVVVGEIRRAFRWTVSGGMEDLKTTYAHLLTDGSELLYAYAISPDGRYIVGWGINAATGRYEAYLLDAERTTTAVESRGREGGLQGELRIFPMPSAGAATLRFVSEQVGPVILEVVDVLGRVVFRWSGQVERVGVQSLGVSLGGLSSGRYQVRLRLPGQQVLTAPLVVVR